MLVLHALWDTARFNLWAESSVLPLTVPSSRGRQPTKSKPRPHPFSVPDKMLSEELADIFGQASSGIKTRTFRLPSTKRGPIPSPWLVRDDIVLEQPSGLFPWYTETLTFDPYAALNLLLDLPVHPPHGIAFGSSLQFWILAARFTLEIVARQQFAPTVREGSALWVPIIDEEDENRLQILSKALPPSCQAFEVQSGSRKRTRSREKDKSKPLQLVMSFINATVDAFVRRSLITEKIQLTPPHSERQPDTLPLQFLHALVNEDSLLKAPIGELNAFSKKIQNWHSHLKPVSPNSPFRICFRLDAPSIQEEDGGIWQVRIFLQAKDDKSLLVPAEEVWKVRSDTATILRRKIKNSQEILLAELGNASRISPQIEMCLQDARPSVIELETGEAYSFLRESAPLLEQNGFGVLLPSWWEKPGGRLGLKLRLIDPEDEVDGDRSISWGLFGLKSIVNYDFEVALGDATLTEMELRELIDLKVPLVRVRGEWVELPPDDIEAAIRFFERRREEGGGEISLEEAIRLGLGAETIDGDLPVVKVEADGRIYDMLNHLSGKGEIEAVNVPTIFMGTLRDYQAKGLSWLSYLHNLGFGACLADDMGLGKTIELIAFLLHERAIEEFSAKPTLLICPMSVVGNWQRELERFGPSLNVMIHHGPDRLSEADFEREAKRHDLIITTYATAQRDEDALSRIFWHNVVLDEAQNIKNPAAKQTRAAKVLKADHKIALTGTPVENHLSELWSIMDFLNPGYLGSAQRFHENFALPIEKYRDLNQAERLRRITQPFILRRLKTDPAIIRDLPDKVETKIYYHLTPEQATLYGAVVEDMLARIECSEGIERRGLVLSALTKLKQICNHPALFLQDGSQLDGRSGKLTRLEEMLEEVIDEGDKALIFTQFAGMGAMLRHHIQDKLGREVLFLHGKTPKKTRDVMIQRFQSDGPNGLPLFILSLKAGGFGLNLTAANYVFHFDRWWNPAVENQATDRAFRIGQNKNVFVNKFVCMGTLEERIDKMIEDKKELAESVIGSGEAWLTELSYEELRDILALSREAIEE